VVGERKIDLSKADRKMFSNLMVSRFS